MNLHNIIICISVIVLGFLACWSAFSIEYLNSNLKFLEDINNNVKIYSILFSEQLLILSKYLNAMMKQEDDDIIKDSINSDINKTINCLDDFYRSLDRVIEVIDNRNVTASLRSLKSYHYRLSQLYSEVVNTIGDTEKFLKIIYDKYDIRYENKMIVKN